MDRTATLSSALFAAFCSDCGVIPESRDPFDPFPSGIPIGLGPREYAKYSAIISLFKKSEVESSDTAEDETLAKFAVANRTCCNKLKDHFDLSNDRPDVGYSISYARQLLYQVFTNPENAPTMASIEVKARFGPGASIGLRGRPSAYYFKVGDAAMTASSDFVRSWYKTSVSFNPLCEAAEMARQARHGDIELESCGSLSFVPKSYASRRIVVTEPTVNTYFQLGLGGLIEGILSKEFGIDFGVQPGLNAQMAEIGSMDGSYATMDLSQCSDYISLELCRFMFPRNVFDWMKILRTGTVRIGKARQTLGMMSTMGNGFTFPMQTVLLAALVLGVYDTLGIGPNDKIGKTWGVFGDDIVIKTQAYNLLSLVLARLGLVVNASKSFSEGPFRESCGKDYYLGYNVRGVYLKRYTTDQDLFSCFNRIAIWGARHGLEMKNSLATVLAFAEGTTPIVPPDEGLDSGIILPLPPVPYNADGQWAYSRWVPVRSSFCFDYWELFSIGELPNGKNKTRRFKQWLSDLKRLCDGSVNEPALLKTLLAGGVRRGSIAVRAKARLRYRLSDAVTPRWGYSPVEDVPMLGSPVFVEWDRNVRLALEHLVSLTS